ncbi:RNA-binding motif protein, X-linked 2 [Erysiphe neolycopersici]|uniref:RNA-binding motif protein, X-linked 2 n=1 Tax=Erysiphe neolycopersici TaxID=212602 RepID=A0A420HWZ1_9PEZI|nr:RNA-binding motif protein, X-linked 2 [Erysiphe neolycopersici]
MNSIRRIRELNQRELELGVSPQASWHTDYRDTAYIYIGGLPLELSEGDIITIFSQYGEPTFVNLVRDKETGKSRGFAFLKYEDQRSTDLAVDNLGGAVILGRTLNVDHTRYQKNDENPNGQDKNFTLEPSDKNLHGDDDDADDAGDSFGERSDERWPISKEGKELANLIRDLDDEDPMKSYFVQEKRDQIAAALTKHKSSKSHKKSHKHISHHSRSRNRSHGTSGRDKNDSQQNNGGRHRRHN